jgi:hypothetical protein
MVWSRDLDGASRIDRENAQRAREGLFAVRVQFRNTGPGDRDPARASRFANPLFAPLFGPTPVGGKSKNRLGSRGLLGVVLAEELRRLGRTLREPGFLKDRRDLGV